MFFSIKLTVARLAHCIIYCVPTLIIVEDDISRREYHDGGYAVTLGSGCKTDGDGRLRRRPPSL